MKFNIGKKIRIARAEKEMTQQELAKKLKISHSSIVQYENNSTNIPTKQLFKIGQILEKPVSYFFEEENEETKFRKIIDEELKKRGVFEVKDFVKIPVYAEIPAGKPIEVYGEVVEYLTLAKEFYKPGMKAIKITSESMREAGILKGSYCLYLEDIEVRDNDIAIVYVQDVGTTVKKTVFTKDRKRIKLMPANSHYKTHEYNIKDVRIIGKVVEVTTKF